MQAVINDLCNESFPSWDPELLTHKGQNVFPSYVEVFLVEVLTQQPAKDVLVERALGELPTKGIRALSSRPPSVRTGRKRRSGLLLKSVRLASRSLYSSSNDSIWAILHETNAASLRSSSVKILVCHLGGGLTFFTLHLRLNLYLIHHT